MAVTEAGKIAFYNGVNEYLFPKPNFGYTTKIILPYSISKNANATWDIYDNGVLYDTRQCTCEFILNETEQQSFITLFAGTTLGRMRDSSIYLSMINNSGFFPFGADYGDSGYFQIVATLDSTTNMGMAPFRHFRNEITMTLISANSYTIPEAENISFPVTIGSVQNIPFPDLWFKDNRTIKRSVVSLIGGGYSIRAAQRSADSYSCEFGLRLRGAKCAELLKYLTDTGRTESISEMDFIVPSGCYPFGRGMPGTNFLVKLIQDQIEIIHNGFNQFNVNIKLAYKG